MAWLIGIICVILIVIFWRIFVPIALIAAVGLGLVLLYMKVDSDRSQSERARAEQEVRERVAKAQAAVQERVAKARATGGDVVREWEVSTETDPASGEKVPRFASVLSDDGLCRLQVEQRINADRLTGIYCPGLKVADRSDTEVKFDNRSTSDKMQVKRFSNGDDIFIPSMQFTSSGQLPYNEFLRRMTGAKKVALLLNIEWAGQHWITFSLVGSGPALTKIGAIAPASSVAKGSTQKKLSIAKGSTQEKQSGTQRQPDDGNTPRLPANAKLNIYGNDWECVRGYRQSGSECVPVGVSSAGGR